MPTTRVRVVHADDLKPISDIPGSLRRQLKLFGIVGGNVRDMVSALFTVLINDNQAADFSRPELYSLPHHIKANTLADLHGFLSP